jgi:LysR family nod box-dependent transcriptional activator
MQLDRLDLNHLVVLDALLTERSVTRAGRRVFLSQPATSCALARLRAFFGDPLLAQNGRSMELTVAAQRMVTPLRELLRRVETLASCKPVFDPATASRTLLIETSDYLMTVLLAQVVSECAKAAPNLRFEFRLNGSHSHERLERGETDFVIAPRYLVSPRHPTQSLLWETFSCLVWSGNRKIGQQISTSEFFSAGHVTTDWSGGLPMSVEDAVSEHGRKRRHEVTVSHYTLIPKFIVGTDRIATILTRLARKVAQSAPLRVLPCPAEVPVIEEVVQYHRFQERDPVLSWFTDKLRQVAASMPAPALSNENGKGKKHRSRAPATRSKASESTEPVGR